MDILKIIIPIVVIVMILIIVLSILLIKIGKYKLLGKGLDDCFKMTILNDHNHFKFHVDEENKHYYNKLIIDDNLYLCSWFFGLKFLKEIISQTDKIEILNYNNQINENTTRINTIINDEDYNLKINVTNDIKKWLSLNKHGFVDDLKTDFIKTQLPKYKQYFNQEETQKIKTFKNANKLRTFLRDKCDDIDNEIELSKNEIKTLTSNNLKLQNNLEKINEKYILFYDKPHVFISIENNENYSNYHRIKSAYTEIYLLLILSYNSNREISLKINSINNKLIKSMEVPTFEDVYTIKFLNYNYNSSDNVKNTDVFNKYIKRLQNNIIELITKNEISNPIVDDKFVEEYHIFELSKDNLMECINVILTIHNIKLVNLGNYIDFEGNNDVKYCKKLYDLLNGSNILSHDVNPDILLFM